MIEACERIIVFSTDVPDTEVTGSGVVGAAILHQLVVLGEAAKHVPQVMRTRRPAVPWEDIAGMRDMIVHYYFGLDEDIVRETVRSGVPAALPQLRSLLSEIDAERV
jgi:uncharacterized protein with HEPN domain